MKINSIKVRAVLLILIIMVTPVVIFGALSTLYYKSVIQDNIQSDYVAHARAVSAMTSTYMDSAILYLKGQSIRPSVAEAVNNSDIAFLNDTMRFIQSSDIYYAVYVTNNTGTVISSYPNQSVVGRNDLDKAQVRDVLKSGSTYVGDGVISPVTEKPTVYIGVPLVSNGNITGVLVGALDLPRYSSIVINTQSHERQYLILVNRTGHVMVHSNRTYMDTMQDFSLLPAVQQVLNGSEGIGEQYNPFDREMKLIAYSPVPKYGWGVLVSIPTDVAYAPISNSIRWLTLSIGALALLSVIVALLMGSNIVNPLLKMTAATGKMPNGDYRKDLPLKRQDEIGDLARSYDRMAGDIRADRQNVIEARDKAEEEKRRAELYVDIMGHDINNLNQTALLSLELLAMARGIDEGGRKFLDKAIASVRGSAGIIENVRKIQQITGEKLEKEKVDIDSLISVCISESPRPPGKKVTINYEGHSGMYVCASTLLKEAFCNLINNSIKYSREEVTIDIAVKRGLVDSKESYIISIADNGIGIPDDLKPRLFRRFERGETKAHGKGLGLYIVRTLVERFGGTVSVEDRVPGDYTKGARFIITLPTLTS